jgi:hypothetical protein
VINPPEPESYQQFAELIAVNIYRSLGIPISLVYAEQNRPSTPQPECRALIVYPLAISHQPSAPNHSASRSS